MIPDAVGRILIELVDAFLETGKVASSDAVLEAVREVAVERGVSLQGMVEDPAAFAQEAEELGLIAVLDIGRGAPELIPVDVDPPVEKQRAAKEPINHPRIRRDLWEAFVDWKPAVRYYSRTRGRAVVVATESGADRLTLSEGGNSDDHVAIQGIEAGCQVEWMRAYASAVGHRPARDELLTALEREYPIREFLRVAESLDLLSDWRTKLVEHVGAVIAEWCATHDLQIAIFDGQPPPGWAEAPVEGLAAKPSTPSQSLPSSFADEEQQRGEDDRRREAALSVLARLPLSELLRLPISLEYALPPEPKHDVERVPAATSPPLPEAFTKNEAFTVLKRVVTKAHKAGIISATGAVKQRMVRESSGAFSETALGYERFEDFLREAERLGHVRLRIIPDTQGNKEVLPMSKDDEIE